MKIAFISCTKLKESHSCTAKEMYQKSTLFRKAVNFIDKCNYDEWFVLSAKYGLLRKDNMIEPYDMTLNNMKVTERRKWAELVLEQIEDLNLKITHIDFYAGEKYREYLIPKLEQKSISCNVPLQGKGIGEQLKFYTEQTKV